MDDVDGQRMADLQREFAVGELVEQLQRLGVTPGGVLLVHTSFRAVRPVEEGIRGLIEALLAALGHDGTLVMPSWTGDDETPFDPANTPPAEDLGAAPKVFSKMPKVVRSDHPFAFAAKGPQAGAIVGGDLVLPPHCHASPIGRVLDLDGQILLLGVGHDANTMLHLAELLAGVPYRTPKHITVLKDGKPHRLDYEENDHCCERFALADDWLREAGAQSEGPVGHGLAKLFRARDLIRVAVPRIEADPLVFLHPEASDCAECAEARKGLD
ncbi:MAG: AAC(3) family N-acetyltransferase [Rhodomicrobiaceae bacterium]